jgi:hypothetical protein
MTKSLSYRDAVVLLGGDPPAVAALDRALGGALSLATGGVSTTVLSIVDAQPRIIGLGRDLVLGLRDRLRGVRRADRTRRLEAAHAVIVVTAYFEALADAQLPAALGELRLTRDDQLSLAGVPDRAQEFLDALLGLAPPMPSPHLPYEDFLAALRQWYGLLSSRLVSFATGLPGWDRLDDAGRAQAEQVITAAVCEEAVSRFRELYLRLSLDIPEFGFWSGHIEHQATRAEVRRALAGVETLLASVSPGGPPVDVAAALSGAYRAALGRPILAEGEAPSGVRLPTLEEGYLDPDFRVRAVTGGDLPADEAWWKDAPVRSDLTGYLAGALTSPEAASAPLVVLGQPGAGKSVLTKVLAARLPASDFMPVRVVLREAPADADIQDQVEYAIRAATGESADWPKLARAAGGAVPVVLLDGFDELLQATGVSQSDYLTRVARFQQREADQGRPVVVLVTSRTTVADRARYPDGAVALRLEPFRPEQRAGWLERWNQLNAPYLAARGLSPLPDLVAARHQALACQPLLLLMLALYDADANALQRGPSGTGDGSALDETALYEELLTAFARREAVKSGPALPDREISQQVQRELQRLSLVAFGIVNRQRQWVTEAELDSDLTALLGTREHAARGFKAPLTHADAAVGGFFFIQRAQAVRGGARLQAYEFLHATFGEYLAARLAVQLAAGLLNYQDALTVGQAVIHDDLLYALLSYAPLSSRQMLRFVRGTCTRQVRAADRAPLAGLLTDVLAQSASRTEDRHPGYRPAALATSSRHGIYGANLVLLILALNDPVSASELFPGEDDPARAWNRRVLLWRSALSETGWTELALAMSVRHTWNGPGRDLEVRFPAEPPEAPEPVDPYWLYRYRLGRRDRGHTWYLGYWGDVHHKMDVAAGTNDSVILHAVEPFLRWLGPAVTSFTGTGDGPAASLAHDLLNLWLSSELDPQGDPTAAYERLGVWAAGIPPWDTKTLNDARTLILSCLRNDAARLPAPAVTRILESLTPRVPPGAADFPARHGLLILQTALAASSADLDPGQRADLAAVIAETAAVMCAAPDPATALQAWIMAHHAGFTHSELSTQTPEQFLSSLPLTALARENPQLLRQVKAIAATRYGVPLTA